MMTLMKLVNDDNKRMITDEPKFVHSTKEVFGVTYLTNIDAASWLPERQ